MEIELSKTAEMLLTALADEKGRPTSDAKRQEYKDHLDPLSKEVIQEAFNELLVKGMIAPNTTAH